MKEFDVVVALRDLDGGLVKGRSTRNHCGRSHEP